MVAGSHNHHQCKPNVEAKQTGLSIQWSGFVLKMQYVIRICYYTHIYIIYVCVKFEKD